MNFKTVIIVFSVSFYFATGLSLTGHNYLFQQFHTNVESLNLSVETKWIQQPVDHFNKSETRVWNMKYYENLEYWKPGGPIYLYIGGEGAALKGCVSRSLKGAPLGILDDLAMETHGAMMSSEHRYYGDSVPLKNFTVQNLQYLSSRQALADVARLIKEKRQTCKSSKVVVIGGSYSGNLAVWMRLLYPDLVDAAISISGPVLARVNYFEYLETVTDDLKKYATECFDNITAKLDRLKNLLKTESGIRELKKEAHICAATDMGKRENQMMFMFTKIVSYGLSAQYGTPESIKNDACSNFSTSARVASVTEMKNILYREFGYDKENEDCIDYDLERFIRIMKKQTNPIINFIPWTYQTCTEFGFFAVSPQNEPFSNMIELSFFYKICTEAFGPSFDAARIAKGVNWTNEMYGGLNPQVTNVVFVHGDIDPWRTLGIVKDLSDEAPARVIPRVSHCPLLLYGRNESKEVLEAKAFVKGNIKKWIGLA